MIVDNSRKIKIISLTNVSEDRIKHATCTDRFLTKGLFVGKKLTNFPQGECVVRYKHRWKKIKLKVKMQNTRTRRRLWKELRRNVKVT